MIEIAAYMLCKLGGKDGSAGDIKAVIEAAGGEANDDLIGKLAAEIANKDVEALLKDGMEKLADVPLGGSGGGGGGGAGGGGGGDAGEAKEEEKEEEEEEEADLGGGMAMFGDDDGGDY